MDATNRQDGCQRGRGNRSVGGGDRRLRGVPEEREPGVQEERRELAGAAGRNAARCHAGKSARADGRCQPRAIRGRDRRAQARSVFAGRGDCARRRTQLAPRPRYEIIYGGGTGVSPVLPGGDARLSDVKFGLVIMEFSIDHLGIAVKSLTAAKSIYEKLGLSVSPEETVDQEKVRLVMVPLGESRLELLEATTDSTPNALTIATY